MTLYYSLCGENKICTHNHRPRRRGLHMDDADTIRFITGRTREETQKQDTSQGMLHSTVTISSNVLVSCKTFLRRKPPQKHAIQISLQKLVSTSPFRFSNRRQSFPYGHAYVKLDSARCYEAPPCKRTTSYRIGTRRRIFLRVC